MSITTAAQVAAEIDAFEAELARFQSGELAPERFRAFRLTHGVYGQRQPGFHMLRVKLPAGVVAGRQLARLADVAERLGGGTAHLTTRQDVQIHYVKLEDVARAMRLLAEAGLSTREACGNSVRNVTACPVAGYVADEMFDVRPYALGTWAFLVRNPFCQQLARKLKIAFSACPEDCAATAIHDIGAVGRIERAGGRLRYGFRLLVGGGLGSTPFVAQTLEEFVPVADLLPTIKAILKVTSAHGNRRNKGRARLKFVVHKVGIETFRDLVASEKATLTPQERAEADLRRFVADRFAATLAAHLLGRPAPVAAVAAAPSRGTVPEGAGPAPGPWAGARGGAAPSGPWAVGVSPLKSGCAAAPAYSISAAGRPAAQSNVPGAGAGFDQAFDRWRRRCVRPHRDPRRAVVTVVVPLGDLPAPTLRAAAELVSLHADDQARVGIDQNLVLPNVPLASLPALHEALRACGLDEATAGTALDVTCCPGADTCGLGITSSKGLTRAIRGHLLSIARAAGPAAAASEQEPEPLEGLRGVTIKVSGCPNSCGQHHVASIGLHGVVRRIGSRQAPAYQLHLGGSVGPGRARIGRATWKVAAKRAPGAVAALLDLYREGRTAAESFPDFVERVPAATLEEVLRPFLDAGTAQDAGAGAAGTADDPEGLFTDWGQDKPYSTDERGAGECAGAGVDLSTHPFDEYEAELLQASLFMKRGLWADAAANLNRSQYTLARALLKALGRAPESDYECACELKAHVIDRGLGVEGWESYHGAIERLLRSRSPEPAEVESVYDAGRSLLKESQSTHARLSGLTGSGVSPDIPA